MLAWVALLLAADDVVPATRLVYVPPQKLAAECPTKLEVEEGVSRRIGRSPFAEPAAKIVVLTVEGDTTATKAKVELFDPSLTKIGERALESGGGCQDLVEAAELAISIALAPSLAFGEKPPPPPPEPAPKAEPLVAEGVPVEAPAMQPMPLAPSHLPGGWRLLVGGGFDASLLLGPDAAAGPSISAALRNDDVDVRLERHEHIPGWDSKLAVVHGAGVFTVAPCLHWSVLDLGSGAIDVSGCATGSVGDVWGIGAYIGGSPYVGGGGRMGTEWHKPDLTAFRAWAQLEWSIVRPSFPAFNGPAVWSQDAPVNVAFGLSYEIPWNF